MNYLRPWIERFRIPTSSAQAVAEFLAEGLHREKLHVELKAVKGTGEPAHEDVEHFLAAVCAFANTEGGLLLFGIDDGGRPTYVQDPQRFAKKLNALGNGFEPASLKYEAFEVACGDDHRIVAVAVEPSPFRPHRINSKSHHSINRQAYIRTGESSAPLPLDLMLALSHSRTFFAQPCLEVIPRLQRFGLTPDGWLLRIGLHARNASLAKSAEHAVAVVRLTGGGLYGGVNVVGVGTQVQPLANTYTAMIGLIRPGQPVNGLEIQVKLRPEVSPTPQPETLILEAGLALYCDDTPAWLASLDVRYHHLQAAIDELRNNPGEKVLDAGDWTTFGVGANA